MTALQNGEATVAKKEKAIKRRSGMADFVTLVVCIACTVWAFRTIVALGG